MVAFYKHEFWMNCWLAHNSVFCLGWLSVFGFYLLEALFVSESPSHPDPSKGRWAQLAEAVHGLLTRSHFQYCLLVVCRVWGYKRSYSFSLLTVKCWLDLGG